MKNQNKNKIPITTAHQARLQVFQPTRRPNFIERIIKTSWGTARIKGKLGQQHADFLESLFYHREGLRQLDSGQIQLLVDPYKVRITMGGGKKYSYSTIWKIADEIKGAVLDLRIELNSIRILGGIIDEIIESPISKNNNFNKNTSRYLWKITIARAFSILMCEDLHIDYNPSLIAKIGTGISQAITRWCMTHKDTPNYGWDLDYLIKAVGGIDENNHSQSLRDRRREVHRDAEKIKNCGVIIENNRVFLAKNKDKTIGLLPYKIE